MLDKGNPQKLKLKSNMRNNHFIGVGIDIEDIGRFNKINLDKNNSFLKKIFTASELKYCLSKKFPAPHLAVRFSGKEAIYKALHDVLGKKKLAYNEIEIIRQKSGAPAVKIKNNKFNELAILISLSYSMGVAAATAIAYENKY